MRFPIRPVSAALIGAAVVLLCALAGPSVEVAGADPPYGQYFNRDYLDHRPPWQSTVPPPAFDDLPLSSYRDGQTCKNPPGSEAVRRYCQLSLQCLATKRPKELTPWCDVLGEVINDSSSLRACARTTDPACSSARARLGTRCSAPDPLPPEEGYLCNGFFAVYPSDRTAPVPAPVPAPGQVPADATDIQVRPDGGGDSDVVGQNGGSSPFCKRAGLDAGARKRCEAAGSIARAYPLSSYGLDNHIELSVTRMGNFFPSALQGIGAVIWQGLIFAINGVLLILEWAFSLDLVGRALGDLTGSLTHLNDDVLGESWMLLAISVAGLWGIWNGLVRLRTMQTLGSLAMTVLLMCAALILIHTPRDTVGRFSELANEGSLSALSVASQGTIENPPSAYAKANEKLFDSMVLHPWCALQFGDVDFCLSRPGQVCTNGGGVFDRTKCRGSGGAVADAWLAHPAGSKEREQLFNGLKDRDEEKVRLQEAGGTGSRIGLLVLVAIGLLGAVALLLYLAIKLMLAAIFTLILLLMAPVMLIVPAFGDAGRNAFVTWLKRLAGAIAAKLIYALFLAIVVLIAGIIAGLDGIGWYPKWMLLLVFWWGVLIKRHDLVGFVMPSSGGGSGFGLLKAYFGYRAVKEIGRDVVGAASYVPKKAAGLGMRAGGAARSEASLRRRSRDEAVKRDAQRGLERRARGAVGARKAAEMSRARGLMRGAAADRTELGQVRDDLSRTDRDLGLTGRDLEAAQRERGRVEAELVETPHHDSRGRPSARRTALQAKRDELDKRIPELERRRDDLHGRADGLRSQRVKLEGSLADPDLRWAESVARRGPAGGEVEVDEREIRDWIAARQRELAEQHPGYDHGDDARDRELIVRVDGAGLSRHARGAARRELDFDPNHSDVIRGQAREIRRSLRREASWNRRRSGMFRR